MKDVSLVVTHDDAEIKGAKHRISILFKGVWIAILAVAPLTAAGIWFALQTGPLMIVGIGGVLALALFGVFLSFFAFKDLIAAPLNILLLWIRAGREKDFAVMPLLPKQGSDEIGELGRSFSSLTALLSQIKEQNTILMEEKTLFMTIAAHQLRTPLTALLWSIDALLSPTTSPADREKLLTDVDATLKRMRLIINHILASANAEGGRFGYVFEMVDLVPMIEKLIEEFKPVAESRGIAISVEKQGELKPVYADAERISLALFDLVSNAIDYTPRGGSVVVSMQGSADYLEVAVSDSGIGISEAEIPMLFSKFYRSDRARHMRPDGSGLGLYLLRNIIQSHGSDIVVVSKEGSGSRFSFTLGTKKPA